MADEFDSGKCFDSERGMSEISEVASAEPILEEQKPPDPPSQDHKASKIDPSAKEEIKSRNTQMKKANLESPKESMSNAETKETDSGENFKNCETCFPGGESPKGSEINLENKEMINSGGNFKNRALVFPGRESPKESDSNLENEETNSGEIFKDCEVHFAGGESPRAPESNLENEETNSGENFKDCEVGFAGGESPKAPEPNLENEKSGNSKNCELGFSGGEKIKKGKKVNFQSPKESQHNAATQNTNSGGNFKKSQVGFAGGEKTKKWMKVVKFEPGKETEPNAETQNTNFSENFRKCEVGLAGAEKPKKWKKVKFDSPKESEYNAETVKTNFARNSKKCELGFAGGEKTKKWKKVVKSESPKDSVSNLENEDTNFGRNFKIRESGFSGDERSVSKLPLQEVWNLPVSDDWNTNFDSYGATSSGAAKSFKKDEFLVQPALGSVYGAMTHVPMSNQFNRRPIMSDSFNLVNGFENSSRAVDNKMFENVGIPISNLGVPLGNVGYPYSNFGVPLGNVGYPFSNVGVPFGNVDNLKRDCASEKCALKIAVVDDTALIETCLCKPGNGVRKENGFVGSAKPHKKKTVTIRNNIMNEDAEGKNQKGNQGWGNGKAMNPTDSRRGKEKVAEAVQSGLKVTVAEAKISYSRKEMEAMRYKNLDEQQKKWNEVRSGFSPDVASEYDGLVDCGILMQISSNVVSQQQSLMNQETRGILGAGAAAYGRGNQPKLFVH